MINDVELSMSGPHWDMRSSVVASLLRTCLSFVSNHIWGNELLFCSWDRSHWNMETYRRSLFTSYFSENLDQDAAYLHASGYHSFSKQPDFRNVQVTGHG